MTGEIPVANGKGLMYNVNNLFYENMAEVF